MKSSLLTDCFLSHAKNDFLKTLKMSWKGKKTDVTFSVVKIDLECHLQFCSIGRIKTQVKHLIIFTG